MPDNLDPIAKAISDQAADIARLQEQVEALTRLVGQLDLRVAAIEGKPLHVSDRSDNIPGVP